MADTSTSGEERDCQPDIAEVLAAHRPRSIRCYPMQCRCGAEYTNFPAHQAQAWRDACTITTVAELDALPFLTIVRRVGRASPSGTDYGPVWERRTSGWHCIAGGVDDRVTAPPLPIRLIWHPGWAR